MAKPGKTDVTITGTSALAKRLKGLPKDVERAAIAAVKEVTLASAKEMRRRAPRDTGALQESIVSDLANAKGLRPVGIVRATAPHVTIVNEGTSTRRANPFATTTAESARKKFPRVVAREVRKAAEGKGR
ncbi:MAG: hypothetical protein REI11_11705 [Patulibacter sp.]|nr:hypothetical protein [Patulibacter sp.]